MHKRKNGISFGRRKFYYLGMVSDQFKKTGYFSNYVHVNNNAAFNIIKEFEYIEDWNKVDIDKMLRNME